MKPVSILMPIYGTRESDILNAVYSVLYQTYPDVKLIIYDDYDTDRKKMDRVCRTFTRFPNCSFLRGSENKGRGRARQFLLETCDTEYGCWMDSDDMMDETKIEKQMAYMEQNPDCNFLATLMLDVKNGRHTHGCNTADMIRKVDKNSIKTSNPLNTPTILFKTQVASKFKFKPMNRNEDWEYYKDVYDAGYTVDVIDERLYLYTTK